MENSAKFDKTPQNHVIFAILANFEEEKVKKMHILVIWYLQYSGWHSWNGMICSKNGNENVVHKAVGLLLCDTYKKKKKKKKLENLVYIICTLIILMIVWSVMGRYFLGKVLHCPNNSMDL